MHSFQLLLPTFLSCIASSLAAPAAAASPSHRLQSCNQTSGGNHSHEQHGTSARNVAYFGYYYENEWKEEFQFGKNSTRISLLPMVQNNSGITHLNLFGGSLTKSHPDMPIIHGYLPNSTYHHGLWPEVKTLQENGIKVLLTLGGYLDDSYLRLSEDFDKYYAGLRHLLKTYKLDGLDLDIEPASNNWVPQDISLPLKLLQRLNEDMGDDFLLTMTPVAADLVGVSQFSGFSYKELDKAATRSGSGPYSPHTSSHSTRPTVISDPIETSSSLPYSVTRPASAIIHQESAIFIPESSAHPSKPTDTPAHHTRTPASSHHHTGTPTSSHHHSSTSTAQPDHSNKLISFFNAQFYESWGWAGETHDYAAIIAAGWSPSRVILNVEASAYEGSCWLHLAQIQATVRELRRIYPHFGGVCGWEYARAGDTDSLSEPWMWFKEMEGTLNQKLGNETFKGVPVNKYCDGDSIPQSAPTKRPDGGEPSATATLSRDHPKGTAAGEKKMPNVSALSEDGVVATDVPKVLGAVGEATDGNF